MNLKLASSNKKKLKEYQEMFPSITAISIADQKEIVADKDLVVFYKVKQINLENTIIEDTILEVEENGIWVEVVDVKYKLKSFHKEQKTRWVVTLGILENGSIKLFRGTINGTLNPSTFQEHTFGFDSMFYPEEETRSLDELDKIGLKANFSARKKAMDQLLNQNVYDQKKAEDLPDWDGAYQS